MSEQRPTCERCPAPAIVHITDEQPECPTVRHLCIGCLRAERAEPAANDRALDHAGILVSVGLVILASSVFADTIGFANSRGFGWQQLGGIAVAMALVGAGALVGARTVVVVGSIAAGLAVFADYIGFGGSEGFGVQQIVGTIMGLVLIAAGLKVSLRQP